MQVSMLSGAIPIAASAAAGSISISRSRSAASRDSKPVSTRMVRASLRITQTKNSIGDGRSAWSSKRKLLPRVRFFMRAYFTA